MKWRSSVLVRLTAISASIAMSLIACAPDDIQNPDPGGDADPTPGASPELPAVYNQELEWTECDELECATVEVPLDWSAPDGETIELAVNRHPARNPDARIGSLLINPGGPGAPGVDFAEAFVATAGEALLDSYDVIGFDPRGVGASTPVQCGSVDVINEFFLTDGSVESAADLDAANQRVADFAANCREESGALIENIDTVSAVRDMDVIRAAVGDDQLNFLGLSYGTRLGATYAELYPENVGRFVLDAAFDFLLPAEEMTLGQAAGFENSLENYLEWCSAQDSCPLEGSIDEQKAELAAMLEAASEEPYETELGATVNGVAFFYGVIVVMYDEVNWPFLSMALEEIKTVGTANVQYQLANHYLGRDNESGEYLNNSTWVRTAINCSDDASSDAFTYDDIEELVAQVREVAPTFAEQFAGGARCDAWPWKSDEHVTSLDNAATVGDSILVVGTTQDPATPYKWAESLAGHLNSPLLTYDGEGHAAYGRSNQCIIDAVDGFLVDGQMPDDGTQC